MHDAISDYFAELVHVHQRGDATEHTYRPALKTLIEAFDPTIIATNEPARQRCGAPDYVLQKNNRPLGYIETKNIGKDLDSEEYKEQFERYLSALSNLIITDYLRFQFWQNGTKIAEVNIGELINKKIHPHKENFGQFETLLRNFCDFKGTTIRDADELAELLARKAQVLAATIRHALDDSDENRTLQDQLDAFRKILIADINHDTFADMYSQTIVYGMFVARLHHRNGKQFSRFVASENIPASHPFLQNFFSFIGSAQLDKRVRWIVDELADLLRAADLKIIMENFGKQTQTEDPTIHFYETFLTAYDPSMRKNRGVYYTPLPAVQYIIQAVDEILKEDFSLPDGIADNTKIEYTFKDKDKKSVRDVHKVQILDPATGTGTFLAEVVQHIHANIVSRGQSGTWSRYVAEDLLPRLHGFEILMAPYAMAHLKLDMFLERTGFEFKHNQRVGIYLTNSLEKDITVTERFGFITWLTDEAEGANKVKKDTPVMVVVGNPPYNVSTMNKSKFAETLIEQYKKGEGVENERNIQPLSDDYIKFIALGQHYIESNPSGCGILAYISNNSFLDGLIHRQMRKSLLETFDKIYILNLHGNSKKKEMAPDGGKDENVFNIQVGTSINIFVKLPTTARNDSKGKRSQVFYADLFGRRQEKYDFLASKKLKRSGYSPLKPAAPYHFFVPKDFSGQKEYGQGFSIKDIFPVNTSGVATKRDTLFIDSDKEVLIDRMQTLLSGEYDWRFEDEYRVKDSNGYEIKRLLKGKKFNRQFVRQIAYRPFDRRWIYYDPALLARAFYSTMQHLLGEDNVALLTCRQQSTFPFQHAFVSSVIADCCSVSLQTKEWTYVFPLYIYPPQEERRPNLNAEIVAKIEQMIGKKVKPEKLFDYIYAVLHSPKYRKDYAEFLKIDFPRIPYPADNVEFERFAKFGQRLRELHLLEKIPKIKTTFPVADGNEVSEIRYADQRVYINKTQYIGNVPETAWNFYIGGYQPLQKYLKDRKGRVLSFDEVQHYQKIVAVLSETIEIMNEMEFPSYSV